jgi:hypothetical protein
MHITSAVKVTILETETLIDFHLPLATKQYVVALVLNGSISIFCSTEGPYFVVQRGEKLPNIRNMNS